jgi:hypothetical protein
MRPQFDSYINEVIIVSVKVDMTDRIMFPTISALLPNQRCKPVLYIRSSYSPFHDSNVGSLEKCDYQDARLE